MNHSETLVDRGHSHHHVLCWKSVVAGVFISLMAFLALTAFGAGVLGSVAHHAIERESNGSGIATGAGLWLGLSAVISLFMGSYFSVRISERKTNRVGAAHGFVVASVFFVLIIFMMGSGIGKLSVGLGKITESLGQQATNLAADPVVQDTIGQALNGATLKSDAKDVAQGLAIRLLQGNVESAKNFYAYQTGLPSAEVDTKVAQLKENFDRAVKTAGDRIAAGVADAGFSLALTFFVGLIAALFGGRFAAHMNIDRPLMLQTSATPTKSPSGSVLANERGGAIPYILGWLVGVPTSILFLIFVLRSIF